MIADSVVDITTNQAAWDFDIADPNNVDRRKTLQPP
jgi:hypothetical protein